MNEIKKRILVVDDDPKITRQIRLNLELAGPYEVIEENHPTHALTAARESRPDLVLLDVMMPGIDGGELASELRALPKFHDVPVVFLTAAVTAEEVARNNGYIGGDRFLAKPVDPAILAGCVEEQLERRPAKPASQQPAPEPVLHISY